MIDFTNFRDHPELKDYVVFHFTQKDRASFFEEMLRQNNLFFERDEDDRPGGKVFFAIKRKDFRTATEINDESRLKFRQPFIPDAGLRYLVLFLFFLMMGLAIAGMIVTNFSDLEF